LISEIIEVLPDKSINTLLINAVKQELGNIHELQNRKVYEEYFVESEEGLPTGNSLSPLLANVYLSKFDQRMIHENIKMIRYADDFIIMCQNKADALAAFKTAQEELEGKLGLKIYPLEDSQSGSEKVSRVVDPRQQPFSFLSVRFDGVKFWVNDKKFKNVIDKLKAISSRGQLKKDYPKEEIGLFQALIKVKNLLDGWIAAYYFINIENQVLELDKYVNVQLRLLFADFNFDLSQKNLARISYKNKSNEVWALSDNQRKLSGVALCTKTLVDIRKGVMSIQQRIKLELQ
jgi:RNA-directed DNA polymerase